MTSTTPAEASAAQTLMRIGWLLKQLPELPYPYIFAVLREGDFTQLAKLSDNRQVLYAAIQSMISSDDLSVEVDEASIEIIHLLEQAIAESGDKETLDKRVMLGMRNYFDELMMNGFELDRENMVLTKGRKKTLFAAWYFGRRLTILRAQCYSAWASCVALPPASMQSWPNSQRHRFADRPYIPALTE